MARPKKTETTTIETDLSLVLDTPIEQSIENLATELEINEFELRDRLCELVGNAAPVNWETLPLCHEPLIKDLQATLSTRKLELAPTNEPALELPPITEEAPKSKRGKGGKLTQKKTEQIENTRQASTAVSQGVDTVVIKAQLQKGLQTGSIAGTAYLTGFQSALTNTKAQGLTVLAAEMLQELNNTSEISLEDILTEAGVTLSADTQEDLNNRMGAMLGKLETATTEILETGWGNGYSLDAEMQRLTELLNLND